MYIIIIVYLKVQQCALLDDEIPSSSVAIIGGAVGGVLLLLMIAVVLYIVILCVRRLNRKKKHDKITYSTSKLNTDVTMDYNPSYDVIKGNTADHIYETLEQGDSDDFITTDPSSNVHTKGHSKTSEDKYNNVQPKEPMQHSDVDGYIIIYPTTDQSHNVRGIHSHSTASSPKQDEYGVVNQPRS